MSNKKKKQTYHLVEVRWNDTTTRASWADIDEAKKDKPLEMRSVGWLLHKDKQRVVLSPMMSEAHKSSDNTVIPMQWVRAVKRIPGKSITYER